MRLTEDCFQSKQMAIEFEKAGKPFSRLRKTLKQLPGDPSPENVHRLRTATRQIEAVLAATSPKKKPDRRLLKTMKPLRRAAGQVRDMDVLVTNAQSLPRNGDDSSLMILLEHLGNARVAGARELRKAVDKRRKEARRALKESSKVVAGKIQQGENQLPIDANAAALTLTAELAEWPELAAENIHPFRIKLKELRYILQLADNPSPEYVGLLGAVKDHIGEWHDWDELFGIAKKVCEPDASYSLIKKIDSIRKDKLAQALSGANALRAGYLVKPDSGRGVKSGLKKPVARVQDSATAAAASLSRRAR